MSNYTKRKKWKTFLEVKLLNRFNLILALRHPAFEKPGPEARFSKAPETFRARKAIFS